MLVAMQRDLEHDIKALADRCRGDREFAVELYGALCNAHWRHDDGTEWPGGTWRYVADVVAHLRGHGEDYMDFYCSGGEGEITGRVAAAMAALGWRGVGHGRQLRKIDFATGAVEVLGDDGHWIVEGTDGLTAEWCGVRRSPPGWVGHRYIARDIVEVDAAQVAGEPARLATSVTNRRRTGGRAPRRGRASPRGPAASRASARCPSR